MKRVLKDEILTLRNEGKTYEEIRKELKCTKSVISYHCKNAGIASENARNLPSEEIIKKANELYKDGKNLKEICRITGKCKSSIKKYIVGYDGKKYNKHLTASESVVAWRKRLKAKLVEYKGGKCENCGYNKMIEVLQFHHLNPLEKDFNIGGKSWAFETMKLEVDKCSLLCANCHIERHNKRESS